MFRFALPLILLSTFAVAEEIAQPGVAAPPPISATEAKARETGTDNVACVEDTYIQNYARSRDVEKMTRHPLKVSPVRNSRGKVKSPVANYSMRAVRLNLKANHLLVTTSEDDVESFAMDDDTTPQAEHPAVPGRMPPPLMAKDAGPWLYNQGFVNLLDCPKYYNKYLDARNLPKGAIVVYAGGHAGSIEIKTAAGFWSDKPRASQDFAPKMKVIGVYIKPVY